MNVYKAIEESPIRAARHEKGRILTESDPSILWCARNMRSGWQPLYTSPPEYTLGEPLDEVQRGENYITFDKMTKEWGQVTVTESGSCCGSRHAYYADPRPLPVLPEVKDEPKLFANYVDNCHVLTDEGRRRLERLLRESEGE